MIIQEECLSGDPLSAVFMVWDSLFSEEGEQFSSLRYFSVLIGLALVPQNAIFFN